MGKRLPLMFLLLACVTPLSAQDAAPQINCENYLQVPLPPEAAAIDTPKAWPGCDSIHSYAGIGRKADFDAARQCAWSERLAQEKNIEPRYTAESLFGGSAMLAVLYANGEGVEQNKPLALRFACESSLNGDGMAAISALPDVPHVTDKKFRYCDFGYTTFEMNFCAGYQDEIVAQKRLDALEKPWPQTDKDAFGALEKASDAYIEAHGGEVYQGGTIRVLRTNGVEEHQRDTFLAAVKGFESGHLPHGTEADFKQADADLNATYRQAMQLAAKQNFADDDGDIRPEGIQAAERAWLKYRDAWVAFAKLHYPNSSPGAWLTLLTRNRYWSLRGTMCDMGWNDPACKGSRSEN